MADTATITEKAPSSFAAALEKAFTVETPAETPANPELKETKEAPAPKDKKSDTPRDLFKKPDKADSATTTTTEAATADEFDKITAPDFKDDKGKKGWEAQKAEGRRWKTEAQTHAAKLKELEVKIAEYEPLKTQLAERDAKLKEYDAIVTRARIEDHPEFRKEFIDGREKVVGRAKSIIEESGGDPKAIERALNLPSGKARVDALREAMTDLDSVQSSRLGRAIDDLNDLDERAQEKRDKAKESYAELREREKQNELEANAKRTQSRGLEFDDTVRRLRGSLEVLNKSDGHDNWNSRADTIVKEAKAFVDEHPEADIEAEILARSIPAYRDLFIQADATVQKHEAKIAELEAELKKIHGKSPSLASRASTSSGGDKPGKPFSEKMNALMNGGE